jgi:cytochrome c-type biogenesis protein CcsB
MATVSQYLFVTGALLLLFAFMAAVALTTWLALGRRTAAVAAGDLLSGAPQPQLAGAVESSAAAEYGGGPTRDRTAPDALAPDSGAITLAAIGHGLAWASFLLMAASLAARAVVVARGPWGNMYEFSIAFAVGILGGYLLLERRYPIRSLAFLPLGVALFLAGYAATLPATIEPLVPALDNAPLLTVHVAMAMIAYGVLAISFAAAVGYLLQGDRDRFAWLPSRKVLDEVAYRSVIIGFPVFAIMIILGSYWASIAWGRYWGWDPKETSALVTWLIYAVYLHARTQRGWAGRPAALILVLGFGAVLFTYFGNLFFSGLHSYSGL